MKMPEKVCLAVDLIKYLKGEESTSPRKVEDLAKVLGTTKNFLHQVVCHLSKVNILRVVKGPRGGAFLNRKDASVLDVYQAFHYMTDLVDESRESSLVEMKVRSFLKTIVI